MRHKLSRILALLVAMAMLVGLMPVGMFAFAADAVELPAGKYMVDDDWAKMPNNAQVQLTHQGVTYVGRIGQNAFATLSAAATAATAGADVYVAAGVYTEGVSTNKNIGFYGPGADVNPNMPDWSLNPARGDLAKEAVIKDCVISFSNKASTKMVVNGFTFTGSAYINETTSGGANAGMDFSYNRAINMNHPETPGVIYTTNTTTRSGKISYNRVEDDNKKPLMVRNPVDGFLFIGNYATKCTGQVIWVSGEIANANTTPGKIDVVITDNYFDCTDGNAIYANISYSYEASIYIARNTFVGYSTVPVSIPASTGSTVEKHITVVDNYFKRTVAAAYNMQMTGTSAEYDPSFVTISGNVFETGSTSGYDVRIQWLTDKPVSLQFNHFTGTPSINLATGAPAAMLYPMYADKEKTTLIGDMKVETLKLTGTDKTTGASVTYDNVTIDHANQTVKFNDIISSNLKDVTLVGTYTDDTTVTMYRDNTKTIELVDGALDYLVYGTNYAYINLVTSVDNYSYLDYTVIIEREASSDAEITGVRAPLSGTVENNVVDITVDPHNFHPNLTLDYSQGAQLKIYKDANRTETILGTVLTGLAVGKNTYYLTVISENGKVSTNYTLNITRPAMTDAEILEVVSPDYVAFDETLDAFVGTYSNATTKATIDLTVSDRATWELYSDAACTTKVSAENLALAVGDNLFYVKVTSEGAAACKVHTIVLHRTASESANFLLSSTYPKRAVITDTTVTAKVPYTDTTVTPIFTYEGKAWKLYASYDETTGVLSDPITANTLENLAGGEHTYYIEVIAEDGSTRVYTFYLTREYNSLCVVTDIEDVNKLYIDRFDHIIQFEVKKEGEFTPVMTYSVGATIQWKTIGGANIDMPMNLASGQSEYTLVVTAEDGVTKTTYTVLITCIGDGDGDPTASLDFGVAYNNAWSTLPTGTKVYPTIQGKTYKAYIGDNAFATMANAESGMGSYNNTIFAMSGSSITTNTEFESPVKIYGPNYLQNPHSDARYEEAHINSTITLSATAGSSEVAGFTIDSRAVITSGATNEIVIKNNIFDDASRRTQSAIHCQGTTSGVLFDKIVIENNTFNMDATKIGVLLGCFDELIIQNNTFTSDSSARTANFIRLQNVRGGSVSIANNTFNGEKVVAIDSLGEDVELEGSMEIKNNIFTTKMAFDFSGNETEENFTLKVIGNTFDTQSAAINIKNSNAAFENAFAVNKNTFADYTKAITFAGASGAGVVDVTYNYFGRDMMAGDLGDAVACVPYYEDAAMTIPSNAVEINDIKVNGKEPITFGGVTYATISEETATVTATAGAGTLVFNTDGSTVGTADALVVTMDGAEKTVYVVGISKDGTNVVVHEIKLYVAKANPIIAVVGGVSNTITDTDVTINVRHNATSWSGEFATADGSAVKLYDASGKEIAGNVVTLTGATTVTTAKVAGKEIPVKFVKNPSDEKVIYDIPNVYKFEYTAISDIDVYVDADKTTADLTPVVSDGATAKLYEDGYCQNEVNMKAAPVIDGYYFMKVTAADGSERIYSLTMFKYDIVRPIIYGIENTREIDSSADSYTGEVEIYSSMDGFFVRPIVDNGVQVTLYADPAHEVYVKNNVIFFGSNIVTIYAHVTSPDGNLEADYTITLQKPKTANVEFVDNIPAWAKDAVEYVKDKGIVTGSPAEGGGYILDANGKATREMVASFIVRTIGVDLTQFSTIDLAATFVDGADISEWAKQSVSAAVQLGIFSGSPVEGGYAFNPKANITRQEFASAFVRAIGAADENVSGVVLGYKDNNKIGTWALNSVKIMAKLGLMKGDTAGKFNPTASITRAEIIQVIYMYLSTK